MPMVAALARGITVSLVDVQDLVDTQEDIWVAVVVMVLAMVVDISQEDTVVTVMDLVVLVDQGVVQADQVE